jgi:TolB-like protein
MPGESFAFGDFMLDPRRRVAWRRDGQHRLPLTPRVFNALLLFVENPGALLEKDHLLATLWPRVTVEENSLSQVVSALRRALDDDGTRYIRTEARRGFRFVASVTVCTDRPDAAVDADARGIRVAVLPFLNHSNDVDQDYFAAGLMEEIVTALTRIRSLFVIASGSTLTLTGKALQPQVAAHRLGVRYILEGSVRRSASKVRISVRLTDASSNAQIWAERFEGTLADIFALQDDVALSVAGVIEPNINAAETRRAARLPAVSLGCYDLYLRAMQKRMTLQREHVMQALLLLQRALGLDSNFAPALAQAAGCHSQIYIQRWVDDVEVHRTDGLALVERALRACADDASVLAQAANALLDLSRDGEHLDRAADVIRRATELNPGSAYAWFVSGIVQMASGRGQAGVEHLQRSIRFDPISPLSNAARRDIGVGLVLLGKYEEALATFGAAVSRPPKSQLLMAFVCGRLERWQQAREELDVYEKMTIVPAEAMFAHLPTVRPLQALVLETISQIRAS